jgi:uncharacterized protein
MMTIFLGLAAAALQPSFDCAGARSPVEHALCASEELAALDREEARLYRLALAAAPVRRQSLIDRQRLFLRDRNDCLESLAPLRACLRDAYLGDIADLRRLTPGAPDGLSSAPIHFHCDADYPDLYLTLFALAPPQAYVTIPDVNEGQPLALAPGAAPLYVGRYATDWVYDPRTAQVRVGARICTRVG